jgi:hypothetical protein
MDGVTERKPAGMSFETWVDLQIAQSMARGDFDDLPGAGKPLRWRSPDETAYEWVLEKARKENLDLLGMLPPGMRLRRERDLLPATVADLTDEGAVRALAEDYNDRVEQFWRRPQLTPDAVPGLCDVEALVEQWRAARPEPPPPPPPPPAPVARRRWWRQLPGRIRPHS